jgi:hypothetical protein
MPATDMFWQPYNPNTGGTSIIILNMADLI